MAYTNQSGEKEQLLLAYALIAGGIYFTFIHKPAVAGMVYPSGYYSGCAAGECPDDHILQAPVVVMPPPGGP